MMNGLFEPWRALCRQAEYICCFTGMFVCAGGGASRDIHTYGQGCGSYRFYTTNAYFIVFSFVFWTLI